jgi:para-aminobenzoate synthetase component 2
VRAPEVVHGKTSEIHHDGTGLFAGLPEPFAATRYHSLVLEPESLPAELRPVARTADGTLMAIAHRELPYHGVQFHPESFATAGGARLAGNFLALCAGEEGR